MIITDLNDLSELIDKNKYKNSLKIKQINDTEF